MAVSAGVGALIIDLALVAFLCGVMNFQVLVFVGTRQYNVHTPPTRAPAGLAMSGGNKDVSTTQPLGHRITVSFMWIMGMLQFCFFMHATYYMAMNSTDEGTPFPWTIQSQLFFVTLTAMTSKLLFTLRIYKLSKFFLGGKIVSIFLVAVQIVEYAFGFLIAGSLLKVQQLDQLESFPVTWAAWVSMGLAVVTDVTIAIVLACTLVKSQPNLSWTNSSSVMLFAYVLNSGALPAIVSVVILVSYTQGSASPMFLAIEGILPQLHINVFLAMLNARSYLQSARQLNPSVFYIPTSDNAGVIFQPPGSAASHHHQSSYGEYHVRHLGNGVEDEEDGGQTINELGLPLFKLGNFKPSSRPGLTRALSEDTISDNAPATRTSTRGRGRSKSRSRRRLATPTSTTTSMQNELEYFGEEDEDGKEKDAGEAHIDDIDAIFETPIVTPASPRNYYPRSPPPSSTSPPPPPQLAVMVQTSTQESYSSHHPASNYHHARGMSGSRRR